MTVPVLRLNFLINVARASAMMAGTTGIHLIIGSAHTAKERTEVMAMRGLGEILLRKEEKHE